MINLYEPKIYQEDIELVNKILNEKTISGNSEIIRKFEDKLSKYCNAKYCLLTSSGTTALHLAAIACGIESGDEVIVPSLSYIATANVVAYCQATPVFVDVNLEDFQIDIKKIEEKITDKTKAILPVHLYGGVPQLSEIEKLAKKYKLKIIHDSAEALGSKYNNLHSVSSPDVGILSFFPNKIITTGEGGALITNNEGIYKKVSKLRSQGLKNKNDYKHDEIGYNYRITAMSAALGYNQIDKIEKHLESKSKIFNTYLEELGNLGVRFQKHSNEIDPSFWLTVAVFNENVDVKKLKNYLFQNNVDTRRVFYPLHLQEPYRKYGHGVYFNSEKIYNFGLCLPTYPDLSDENLEYIITKIKKFI